jgi:hypothetical protein
MVNLGGREGLFLVSLFMFIFWLCASLMSRLDIYIVLIKRLDAIIIFLILTYFLSKEKNKENIFCSRLKAH